MLISIVIPNYNHSSYLKERIDSVLSQTYQDFELIILDDCSTDHSRAVIEGFKLHPKVSHVVFNDKNSGSTFKQWKKGIELAKGELIWIAESDDWCEHTFLENLIQPFLIYSDLVFSYCSSLTVRDNTVDELMVPSFQYSQVIDGQEWCHLSLLDKIGTSNASAALFKKKALTEVDFDKIQSFKLIGDRLFWFQLAQTGKVHISAKFLNYFRRHGSNVTENRNREGTGFIEYIEFLRIIKEDPSYTKDVQAHVQTRIIDSFLFMEAQKEFIDSEARDRAFKIISSFIPDFDNKYKELKLRQYFSKLKKNLISFFK